MNIFTQFFKSNQKTLYDYKQEATQDLLRKETEITQGIFGPLKEGCKRDFFCLNKHTWIWYEEWTDDGGQRKHMTTRYYIRSTEIVKTQNGGDPIALSMQEVRSLKAAAEVYVQRVKKQLYSRHLAS